MKIANQTGRRILGVLLAIALLLPLAGPARAATEPGVLPLEDYGFAYSTQKLDWLTSDTNDSAYLGWPDPPLPQEWAFSLARNELEGFEFAMRDRINTPRNIRFEVDDFINGQGGAMTPKIYVMHHTPGTWGYVRGIPDALIPYDSDDYPEGFPMKRTEKLQFYVEIRSGMEQPPGEYISHVRVYDAASDAAIAECPVTATVWNFALPAAHYSDTAFDIYGDNFYELNGFEPSGDASVDLEAKKEIGKQYYDCLLDHGINGTAVPYGVLDPRADEYMQDPRVKTFCIYSAGDWPLSEAKTKAELQARHDKAQELGVWDKAFFYLKDEPSNKDGIDKYNGQAAVLHGLFGNDFHAVAPFYKYTFHKDWSKDEITGKWVGGTTIESGDYPPLTLYPPYAGPPDEGGPYNNLEIQRGNSDIICPISSLFTEEYHPGFLQELDEMRDDTYRMWWYVCCGPVAPWNTFKYHRGVTNRLLFWQQYQNDVDGVLYWDTVFWADPWKRAAGDPNPFVNPFFGRDGYNGWDTAGDGLLLYPGPSAPYGAKEGAFPSIRLKNISDGLDDFDYLKMHEEIFGRDATDALVDEVSTSLIKHVGYVDRGHAELAAVRDRVGQALSDYYTPDFDFGLVSSSEQFRLKYIDNNGNPDTRNVPLTTDYALTLAQNEREGFQAAYRERGREGRSIRLEVSDFLHENSIDTLAPEVFKEAYFAYEYQADGTVKGSLDSYADALVPYGGEALEAEKSCYVPFYIELRSAKDNVPGIYTATVTVFDADSGEALSQANATAEVWNFALPEGRYCQTAFGNADNGNWKRYYLEANGLSEGNAAAQAAIKGWYDCLLDHGISGYHLPADVLEDPWAAQEYLTDPRVTSVHVPWGVPNVMAYKNVFADQSLWNNKCYLYPGDEPRSDLEKAKRIGAAVTQARVTCDWPNLSAVVPFDGAGVGIDNGGETTKKDIEIMRSNSIDILCPNQYVVAVNYDDVKEAGIEWKDEREWAFDHFGRVWTYPFRNEYPSFELVAVPGYVQWYKNDPASPGYKTSPEVWFSTGPQRRAPFWQQYQSGYDGVLYWQTAYWVGRDGNAYNPWKTKTLPMAFLESDEKQTYYASLGNAQLIYPSAPIGNDPAQPVVSLRLKQIADGLEDFDYLKLAEEFLGRDFALRALNETGTQMAYRDDDTYYNFAFKNINPDHPEVGYTQHISNVEAMRRRIGDALSAIDTEHDWGEWETILPPDTEHEGMAIRTCRDCDTQESKRIAKLISPSTYTVSFDTNGGTPGNIAPVEVESGSLVVWPAAPTRDGFNFKGWQAGIWIYGEGDPYTVTGDVTFTAFWKAVYTISFDTDGGTAAVPLDRAAEEGASITLTPSPTKDGFAFAGWIADNGMIYPAGSSYTVTGDATLTARWKALHIVRFDTDGGTPGTIDAELVANGVAIILPAAPTKSGYTFAGWKTGVTTLDAGASYTVTANATFTAQWTAVNYTVCFNTDGGTPGIIAAVTVACGSTTTMPAAPTKDGYNFAGWKTGVATLSADASYTITGNVTFTAQWTASASDTSDKMIFTTKYKSNLWNWLMFIFLFGFIWMWF